MENEKKSVKQKVISFHDKHYKKLLLIPLLLVLLGAIYLGIFSHENGSFIERDISLTGGTSITVYSQVDLDQLQIDLADSLPGLNARKIYDLVTQEQKAVIIETTLESEEAEEILENYLSIELTDENSSVEFTGSTLSESFYRQLIIAVIIAFIFMGIVVFILFRTFIPSMAVIISAFADIFLTLALFDLLGMKLSTAGIVAFLMLIAYSVDTDILLTNRVLKRSRGSVNERIYSSFKTGITMTLTSLLAMAIALVITMSFSPVLSQIFSILVIGLCFDILNTWLTNASILKWYALKKSK